MLPFSLGLSPFVSALVSHITNFHHNCEMFCDPAASASTVTGRKMELEARFGHLSPVRSSSHNPRVFFPTEGHFTLVRNRVANFRHGTTQEQFEAIVSHLKKTNISPFSHPDVLQLGVDGTWSRLEYTRTKTQDCLADQSAFYFRSAQRKTLLDVSAVWCRHQSVDLRVASSLEESLGQPHNFKSSVFFNPITPIRCSPRLFQRISFDCGFFQVDCSKVWLPDFYADRSSEMRVTVGPVMKLADVFSMKKSKLAVSPVQFSVEVEFLPHRHPALKKNLCCESVRANDLNDPALIYGAKEVAEKMAEFVSELVLATK